MGWEGARGGALSGPAALGLSVIMALAPDATKENVIGYRAFPGYFGVHGLLQDVTTVGTWVGPLMILALVLASVVVLRLPGASKEGLSAAASSCSGRFLRRGRPRVAVLFDHLTTIDVRGHYGTLFTLLVVAIIVRLMWRFWPEPPLSPQALFLFVALAFMLVVAFGPGYGPQYAYWFIPALVATYVLLDDAWRWLLRIAYLVAGLTYIFEYGFIPWLGAWVPAAFGNSDWTTNVAEFLIPYRLVLVNLPLFATYLIVLAEGIRRLAAPAPTGS